MTPRRAASFWYFLKTGKDQLNSSWEVSASVSYLNEAQWQTCPGVMQTHLRAELVLSLFTGTFLNNYMDGAEVGLLVVLH